MVNIGIAFNYSYTDLTTTARLWRYLGFVIPHSFLSNDGFLVLTPNVIWYLFIDLLGRGTARSSNQAPMLEIKLVSNQCQQTWHLFLNFLISFFLLYSVFSFSRSTFIFPLRLAWVYDIRNLRYEAQCFLTTLKDDNLHYEVSLSD